MEHIISIDLSRVTIDDNMYYLVKLEYVDTSSTAYIDEMTFSDINDAINWIYSLRKTD